MRSSRPSTTCSRPPCRTPECAGQHTEGDDIPVSTYTSRTLLVDGMKTNVIEQGSGPSVVLLHSGEYGASAETSWSALIPYLAEHGYHAVAPDWLGFGQTD